MSRTTTVTDLLKPWGRHRREPVLVVLLGAISVLVLLTFVDPWVFTADDSLFYLVVGRHIAADGAWTFNGLTPTNGVQPLWQMVVAVVIRTGWVIGQNSPGQQLRAVFVVNWGLALLALVQLWRLLTRLAVGDPGRMLGVVVLACALCGPWGMFASEGHLVAVTLLWVLLLLQRWVLEGPSGTLAVVIGVAGGLMVLARLDTVWIAVAVMVCLSCIPTKRPLRSRLTSTLVALAVTSAMFLPYLTWNIVKFGRVVPISGAVKLDLAHPRWSIDGVGPQALVMLAVIWIGGSIGVLRAPRHLDRVVVWLVPTVGATMSSVFYAAVSRGAFTTWWWYFLPHGVALALTVALLAGRFAELNVGHRAQFGLACRSTCAALAVAAVALCLGRYVLGPPDTIWRTARSFSTAMSNALPEDARVATVDMPGVLGLVSNRRVVALDGLTGDFAFQDRWRADGVACALHELGVRYLVTVRDRGSARRVGDSITLSMSSWLHRESPTDLSGRRPLLIWPARQYQLWELDDTCLPVTWAPWIRPRP